MKGKKMIEKKGHDIESLGLLPYCGALLAMAIVPQFLWLAPGISV